MKNKLLLNNSRYKNRNYDEMYLDESIDSGTNLFQCTIDQLRSRFIETFLSNNVIIDIIQYLLTNNFQNANDNNLPDLALQLFSTLSIKKP